MKTNQKENLLKEIISLKTNLDELKEYFFSDFCKQCFNIKDKIDDYEKKISELQQNIEGLD
jgi:hypothetical protein